MYNKLKVKKIYFVKYSSVNAYHLFYVKCNWGKQNKNGWKWREWKKNRDVRRKRRMEEKEKCLYIYIYLRSGKCPCLINPRGLCTSNFSMKYTFTVVETAYGF